MRALTSRLAHSSSGSHLHAGRRRQCRRAHGVLFSLSLAPCGHECADSAYGRDSAFYAVVDAIETALNVWSDSCVAAMVDHDLKDETFDA